MQKTLEEFENKELESGCKRQVVSGEFRRGKQGPTPHLFVSADSKGVISPLFPADPRGACKCGLQRSCGRGVSEVRIIKDLEEVKEAKEVKDVKDVKENARAEQ